MEIWYEDSRDWWRYGMRIREIGGDMAVRVERV